MVFNLSERLIDIVNQRFGTEFKPADQLFFDQIREEAVADSHIQQAARVNSLENFKYVRETLSDYRRSSVCRTGRNPCTDCRGTSSPLSRKPTYLPSSPASTCEGERIQ
jgi:hypothetical protein